MANERECDAKHRFRDIQDVQDSNSNNRVMDEFFRCDGVFLDLLTLLLVLRDNTVHKTTRIAKMKSRLRKMQSPPRITFLQV